MENKEKKINAAELNDENLENVSGGVVWGLDPQAESLSRCDICGNWWQKTTWYKDKNYCSACKEKEESRKACTCGDTH